MADTPRRSDARWREVVVIGVTTLLIVGGLLVVSALRDDGTSPGPGSSPGTTAAPRGPAPKVGRPAPDFTTFSTMGQAITLSELAGKPVWLVFATTACQSCRAEAPDIQAVYEQYGETVEVIGVYVGESLTKVDGYAELVGLTYPQVADLYTDISSAYRVMGTPTHVFINPDGTLAEIYVGPLTPQAAADRLDALLAAGG